MSSTHPEINTIHVNNNSQTTTTTTPAWLDFLKSESSHTTKVEEMDADDDDHPRGHATATAMNLTHLNWENEVHDPNHHRHQQLHGREEGESRSPSPTSSLGTRSPTPPRSCFLMPMPPPPPPGSAVVQQEQASSQPSGIVAKKLSYLRSRFPMGSIIVPPPPPPSAMLYDCDGDSTMVGPSLNFPGVDMTRIPLPSHFDPNDGAIGRGIILPPPPPPVSQPFVVPPPAVVPSSWSLNLSSQKWSKDDDEAEVKRQDENEHENEERKKKLRCSMKRRLKRDRLLRPIDVGNDENKKNGARGGATVSSMKIRRGGVPTSKKRNYMCEKCARGFVQKCHWKRHASKCYGLKERSFCCEYCQKEYSTNSNLLQHVRSVHFKRTVFECEICHKGFPRKSSMKRHLKIHERNGDI